MSGHSTFVPDPSWPSIEELATKLWGKPTSRHGDEVRFGTNGSKVIKPSANTFYDHEAGEGGGYIEIHTMAIGPLPPKPNGDNKAGPEPWHNVGIAYDYRDAGGALIAQNVRMKPGYSRRFMQRRPDGTLKDGSPKWRWSTKGLKIPLYRLPDLRAAPADRTVFLGEGEKDCDRLAAAGLIATTNIAGAASWNDRHNGDFAGRHVVILEDNDDAGRKRSARIAPGLIGIAASVKVLALPGLPPKGDVSDWLDAGGTIEELQRLAAECPEYQGREEPLTEPPGPPPGPLEPPEFPDIPLPERPGGGPRPDEPAELPMIKCVAGELDRMYREAEAALLNAKVEVYQRHTLVHPIEEEYDAADDRKTHSAALIAYTAPAMLKLLSGVAVWVKFNVRKDEWITCDPPDKLVNIMLASRGDWRFQVIRGVLTCPTLRPDGSVLKEPGYDARSRYYLAFPSDLELPTIPDTPTRADALASLARLNALLAGFPFVDDVSHAVALCILMTQVLRCAMQVSPLLAASANAPSTGKTFLIDLAAAIALGRPCPVIPPGKDDNETEKGIRTKLLTSTPAFSIDNVHGNLNLAMLNQATERPFISIRLFGVLEEIEVENSVSIFMTGNNLAVIDEQGRRTFRCCMDAGVERPEFRPFTNNPIETVLANRGRYIADILTIARAYLTDGTKPDIPPMGDSHKAWSRLVREPLVWLGCVDPIASQEISRQSDPVTDRLSAIVGAWHAAFGLEAHTLADAVSYATTPPIYPGEYADAEQLHGYHASKAHQEQLLAALREAFPVGRDGINTHAMGNWMRKFADRLSGGLKFVRAEGSAHDNIARWKLGR